MKSITSVASRGFRIHPGSVVAALAIAAAPLYAGTLFLEDFENPDVSGYEQGETPPDIWVRAAQGYGSGDHGMIDKDSGDFDAPEGNNQAYTFRYTNSGITTAKGELGPPLTSGGAYEVSFDVVKNNSNGGTGYNVRLIAFADGALRNDCRSIPSGSAALATASGNAPADGTWATVSLTFTPNSSHATHFGKDLAIRAINAGSSAIIDNIRFRAIPGPNPGLNLVTTTPLDNANKALTYVPLLAVFDKNIAAGSGSVTLKNLTDSTDDIIPINDPRVTVSGTLLQIQAGDLVEWGKNYAIQIDAGALAEASPGISTFAGIADDTTWNFSTAVGDPLLYSVAQLKSHILGSITLTAAQLNEIKLDLDSVAYRFADSANTITALLDLVSTYDTGTIAGRKGPLWVATSLPKRDSVTNDLHWTMFNVMQNIMDRIYNKETLAAHEALLGSFKFNSSFNFPGNCAPPAPNTHTATISASYLKTFGRKTIVDGPFTFARKPTGTYLAPGTIATITVPPSMVNAGYKVRVGAHSSDFKAKPDIKRLDRVSRTYEITSLETKVANPLGGGIYIEVPFLANPAGAGINGEVPVAITGAVRSPYFSAKSFHTTAAAVWENIERTNPAPWADFQTEKFMMQVPKTWISAMTGAQAVQLMTDWDKAMDAMHDLLGYPRIRGKESLYPQVDLLLKNSVYAPGYPSVNTTYSPSTNYAGYASSHLVRGPQNAPYYEFHELGHGYNFPKFAGESESNVNLPHVAVMNRAFGKSLDEGHRTSMGGNRAYVTLDTTAMAWMCVFNFSPRNVPMHTAEKSYQLKGHAKFVDIAKLYGWEKLDAFWYGMQLDDENKTPYSTTDDALLLRLCKAVGKDIRPLFHFWGIHPKNPAALTASIAAENIPPDLTIRNRLLHYKSLVPANNTAFRAFATGWWGKQPSINGNWEEREHARQWDQAALFGAGDHQRAGITINEEYIEACADQIRSQVDALIDLYYPDAITPAKMTFAIAPAALDATTIGMTATTATAAFGPIQYYFENITNNTNSGWITTPSWSQSGLTTGQSYSFRAMAKDGLEPPYETEWSDVFSATAETDVTPPSPSPMTFETPPTATGLDSITMTASTATDVNGVEYFFDCLTPGGNDSGWQDSPTYTDSGLDESTEYTYQVIARDKSPAQNATVPSAPASVFTLTPDTFPPLLVSLNPADNAAEVSLSANLVATFDEIIGPNTGNIRIKNLTDSTETVIDIDDDSQVTISGDDLTINPSANFLPGKQYAVQIDAGALQDVSGNPFAGITDDSTWNFSTVVVPYVWSQTAGGEQAWTTGPNWQGGAVPIPSAVDTVDLSSANITANTTLTLGADRTAQLWKFGDATSASHDWIVSAGNKMSLTGTTPTIQVVNRTATLNNVVDGAAGLVKSGTGTLWLANTANTYSGGTTINGGTLKISGNGCLGPDDSTVTYNVSSSLDVVASYTLNKNFTLNNGAILSFINSNNKTTITGAVTGTGGVIPRTASGSLDLTSTSNTFTGPITLGSGIFGSAITVNSLADSETAGAGKIYLGSPTGYGAGNFKWGTGANSPLVLTNRQIVLGSAGNYSGTIENANTTAANTVTINSDLMVGPGSGTGRHLILAGTNTGSNTFAGSIGNGIDALAGVTVAVTKTGTGNWRITNANNTFTGAITLNSTTASTGTLSYASAAGTNPITFNQTTGTATLTYTGDAPLTMSGVITATALTTGTITLNASGTAPENAIHYSNPNSFTAVATSNTVRKLVLSGGNTGNNIFNGAFTNNTGTTNAATLTKNGAGTWILTGANAYTGATTVSTGRLFIDGDQSTASGSVSVAANATLGGTGIIGGNTTIAIDGKLEFNLSTNAAGHDKLEFAADKALVFSGASELTITSSGGALPGYYTLITAPGGITGNAPAKVNLPAGWEATVSKDANNLFLNVTSTGAVSDPYTTWALGGVAFDADTNNDGVKNGLAWLLGAANPTANANGLLPAASQSSGNLVLNFNCLNAANRVSAVLTLQYSKDLGATDPWENHNVVVPDASGTVGGVVFVVTPNGNLNQVQATIPQSAAGSSGKLFARLEGETQKP